MGSHGPALARLRKTLRRHAREGWARAVFARPGQDDAPRVLEGPGSGPPDDATVEALIAAASAAAAEGRVKQTLVLDDQRRVRIDARHGSGKLVTLDEDRVRKVMGGKERNLRPDASAPLLRVIGIMNADGTISAKNAKKYKQVDHFVELCRPVWERLVAQRGPERPPSESEPLRVLDLGCGNGYLGFVLAEALRLAELPVRLHGVDRRTDVIAQCRARAEALGHGGLTFQEASIAEVGAGDVATLGAPPELVVALHACDTATDDALALAVRSGASAIMAAPCCQHELAEQLRTREQRDAAPVPAMLQHSVLRQDYAAGLTDALRVELLQACGYHVDAIEFVASEHTPKNLLLRAHRRHPQAPVEPARWHLTTVRERCQALGVEPRLLALLEAVEPATV
ncbi:class I SAM-dependent methyltransferase [Paraliomyxa miuraensis]|uniref:class I SAM-dependent methyltransferase n=1 Tax=Paraliomyxa miuraensis TaxID=376150 RepID=UPI00225B902D|nr:SAM-dependent methyltransferase [Paraliomyxa miuraensis]MCX4247800.1 SAM-dependent methyltransferase [Paraliomyxa miuraensis]